MKKITMIFMFKFNGFKTIKFNYLILQFLTHMKMMLFQMILFVILQNIQPEHMYIVVLLQLEYLLVLITQPMIEN
ncbi:450L [Invertebrate iridescent virus Kaz2018]|nr:450L [Invertebrate iridescent virus Kaz2018]